MKPFISVTAVAAPIPDANVDTDAIIPVTFLRGATKDVSSGLFDLMRRGSDGKPSADFSLNQPRYRDAELIVAGPNFGCGSSREAAVWALTYSGFRCVIAPSFGEIFYENAFKNGLLAAIVDTDASRALLTFVATASEPVLTVDLWDCKIRYGDGAAMGFSIADGRRDALMQGLDEIGVSLSYSRQLAEFQDRDRKARPWIYAAGAAL